MDEGPAPRGAEPSSFRGRIGADASIDRGDRRPDSAEEPLPLLGPEADDEVVAAGEHRTLDH